MSPAVDFDALRRSAGNLSPRDVVTAAGAVGWTFSAKRGKGSHGALLKPGRRPVTVPRKMDRRIALSIISQIEQGADP